SHVASHYLPHTPPHPNMDRWGAMDFSIQGDKLAAINHGVALDTNAIDLLRFDKATGHCEEWVELPHTFYVRSPYSAWHIMWTDRAGAYRGLEFDHSGRYLHALLMASEVPGTFNNLIQF